MSKNRVIFVYENRIDELVNQEEVPALDVRFKIIEDLNEEYFKETGSMLPSHLISKLTDWVLNETLKDRTVDKVTNNEFAILSPRQIKRRVKRETSVQANVLDYLELKYVKNQSSLAKVTRKEHE